MTVQTQIGKITASKDTLNEINLIVMSAIGNCEAKGYEACARKMKKVFNEIFYELDKIGYYDLAK